MYLQTKRSLYTTKHTNKTHEHLDHFKDTFVFPVTISSKEIPSGRFNAPPLETRNEPPRLWPTWPLCRRGAQERSGENPGQASTSSKLKPIESVGAAQDSWQCVRDGPSKDAMPFFDVRFSMGLFQWHLHHKFSKHSCCWQQGANDGPTFKSKTKEHLKENLGHNRFCQQGRRNVEEVDGGKTTLS